MDAKEFGRWWKDYATRFPSTSRWVNDLGENAQGLLRTWAETLADVPLRDAMAITRQMATDQLAPVGSFDSERERTAVIVRRAAKALRASEARAAPVATPPLLRDKVAAIAVDEQGRPVTMREISLRLSPYLQSGRSTSEAREEAFRGLTFANDNFDFRRDACRCLACRDSGIVTIWRPELHEIAIFRPELILNNAHNRASCAAPCRCEKGEKKVWTQGGAPPQNWRGWRSRWCQFTADRFCRVEDYFLGDEEAERFVKWAKGYYERCRKANGNGANDRAAPDSDDDPHRSLDF